MKKILDSAWTVASLIVCSFVIAAVARRWAA